MNNISRVERYKWKAHGRESQCGIHEFCRRCVYPLEKRLKRVVLRGNINLLFVLLNGKIKVQ